MNRAARGTLAALLLVFAPVASDSIASAAGPTSLAAASTTPASIASDAGQTPAAARAEVIALTHRQWVVSVRPAASGAAVARAAGSMSARLASRFALLGLTPIQNLAHPPGGFDLAGALEARARSAGIPGEAIGGAAARAFGLDPARVWLLEAADSLAGVSAAAVLGGDPDIEWIEPNATREVEGWLEPARLALAPHAAAGVSGSSPGTAAGVRGTTSGGAAGVPDFPDDPLFRWGHQWSLFNLGPPAQFGGRRAPTITPPKAGASRTGSDQVMLAIADTGIDPAVIRPRRTAGRWPRRIFGAVNLSGVDPPDSIFDSPRPRHHVRRRDGGSHATTARAWTRSAWRVCAAVTGVTRRLPHRVLKVTVGHHEETSSFDDRRARSCTPPPRRARDEPLHRGYRVEPDRASRALRGHHAWLRGVRCRRQFRLERHARSTRPRTRSTACASRSARATSTISARVLFDATDRWLDLVAPGDNIYTTFMTYPNPVGAGSRATSIASGTSFAAPQVAATIGLLVRDPAGADRRTIFSTSSARARTTSPSPAWIRPTAWGRLDLGAALAAVPKQRRHLARQVAGVLGRLVGHRHAGDRGTRRRRAARRRGVWPQAHEFEVTATVAIPDSFSGAVRVWPRVGVTLHGARRISPRVLRAVGGSVGTKPAFVHAARATSTRTPTPARAAMSSSRFPPRTWRSASPSSARSSARAATPASGPPPLAIAPNPAAGRGAHRQRAGREGHDRAISPAAACARPRVDPATGSWTWDGLDASGRRVRAGVYLVRSSAAGKSHEGKLVLLRVTDRRGASAAPARGRPRARGHRDIAGASNRVLRFHVAVPSGRLQAPRHAPGPHLRNTS